MKRPAVNHWLRGQSLSQWVALLALAWVLAGKSTAAAAREPVYLIMLGNPATFSEHFPPSAPNSPRQFGWGIVLYTLKTPVAALRNQMEQALDTSEKTGYPLLIHVDDWNFPPTSTDPDWVEWTGFPKLIKTQTMPNTVSS